MLIERGSSLAFFCLIGALVANAFSNSLFEIFCGVFLALGLLLMVHDRRWGILRTSAGALLGLYLLAVVVSVLGSEHLSNSLRGLFRVFRCLAMTVLTVHLVNSPKRFRLAFGALMVVAFVMGLDALAQGILGHDLIRGRGMTPYLEGWSRVTGPFHHANDFAAYLSLMTLFFFGVAPYCLKYQKIKIQLFVITGALLLTLCLLWTYARGAWLSVGAGTLLLALLLRSRKTIAILLLSGALIFLVSPAPVKGRMLSLFNSKDGTMTERKILWNESLAMIRQRPWTGFGINTYSKIEPLFKSKEVYTDNQYAHNGYLQIAAETGLFGLAAFALFFLSFFVSMARALPRPDGRFETAALASLMAGIFSLLLHSATDTDLQSLRLVSLLWLSVGLAFSARNLLENKVA